jgi:predicted RecB family nuclease
MNVRWGCTGENVITNEIIRNFLDCHYKAYLKFNHKLGKKGEFEVLQNDLLKLYKAKFIELFRAKTTRHKIVHQRDFNKNAKLVEPMYILEPGIKSKVFSISFDAIEILLHKDLSNAHSYLPVQILSQEKVTKSDKIFVVVKCLILNQMRRIAVDHCLIVYGQYLKKTKIRSRDYIREAQKVLKNITRLLNSPEPPMFYQNNHCKKCEFHEQCRTTLIEKDDLSLLGGMGSKEVLKKYNRGFFTILQLSYTFRPRKRKKAASKSLRFNPALKALALRERQTFIQDIPKLPVSLIEIYIDFEGLPDENFIYLIGVIIVTGGKTIQQYSFWADTKKDEAKMFKRLFKLCLALKEYTIYHYGSYEIRALKKFNKKWNNAYEQKVNLIIEHSIDILSFFIATVYPPTYTNELKEIARFLGFNWSLKDASGLQSIVWRKRWELLQDDKFKEKLLLYNLEDCQALQVVKGWVARINQRLEIQNGISRADESQIEGTYPYRFGKFIPQISSFKNIEKYAYFNYQREKIYLKTNSNISKIIKRTKRQRRINNPINTVVHSPPPICCPKCGHKKLFKHDNCQKIEINLKFMTHGIKKWVTLFKGKRLSCCLCKKVFTPESFKQISRYGHNLMIWSMHQHVTHSLRLSAIKAILLESFHIQINEARLGTFKNKLATKYTVTFENIIRHVISGDYVHVDETQVHVRDCLSAYVWVFATMDTVFYLIRPNRETEFMTGLLQDFNGVLISDFYPGYDSLPYPQQKCLIHLIRDLNSDLFKNQLDTEFKVLVSGFGQVVKKIIETVNRYGLRKRHLNKHHKDVDKFYCNFIDSEYDSELTIKYQKRFIKNREKLFTFLLYDGIPWNNNNAEHAIKPFAKCRREVNGLFTEKSIDDYLKLLSVQQTCKYRGLSFLEFLKSGETCIETYSK